MTKIKKITIAITTIGITIIGYWLLSPLFIQRKVNEGIEEIMQEQLKSNSTKTSETTASTGQETIRLGTFIGADNFHRATGTVRLIKIAEKYYVRFEDDFTITNGPDLFIHFGNNGTYAAGARLSDLKGNIGSQNYEVPKNIDPLQYSEVWIWCRAFSVPFAYARLQDRK